MTFITPALAIAGLAAMSVPILIHLLWRQRRTPVPWAAMRFLLEAYRKHRQRLRLEQWLLLALRCLVLAVAGAAMARPFVSGAVPGAGGARTVWLVVDDGLVSGVRAADGGPDRTELDEHRATARTIIQALRPGDRVGLVTTARPSVARVAPPSTDHAAILDIVDGLEPSTASSDLRGALDRMAGALRTDEDERADGSTFVYLLSSFRAGAATLDDPVGTALAPFADSVTFLAAPPASTPQSNVRIVSIEPARRFVIPGSAAADGSGRVRVRLARSGGALDRSTTTLRLLGDGIEPVDPRAVEWELGQSEATADFLVRVADQRDRDLGLTAEIDADALPADDHRHDVVAVRRHVRVLLVDRRAFGREAGLDRLTAGRWLARALAPTDASPAELVEVEPAALDVADLRTSDVVLLPRPDLIDAARWDLLSSFVRTGGLLLVTPPGETTVHAWADPFVERLHLPMTMARETIVADPPRTLAEEQPISVLLAMIAGEIDELTAPIMVERLVPPTSLEGETLLRMDDGTPFLVAVTPRAEGDAVAAGGTVLYLAAAPQVSETNLPTKPLMIPLLHELVRQGLGQTRAAQAQIVGDMVPVTQFRAAAELVAPSNDRIPLSERGVAQAPMTESGMYDVVDAAGQSIGRIAVNVDERAGRTDPQAESAVLSWLGAAAPWTALAAETPALALTRAEPRSPLGHALLAALLALVIIETILARWFSHAFRHRADGGVAASTSGTERSRVVLAGGAA